MTNINDEFSTAFKKQVGEHRQVVRLTTSCWKDKQGIHIRRSLTTLKRKSSGYQILAEDCDMTSPDEVWSHVVNLGECEDGVYIVVTCNEQKDWETGYIDSYDYKLLPLEQEQSK